MAEHSSSPIYQLLKQINDAAQSGLHLVAIGMASSLPDICASLQAPNGRSNAKDYKKWCDQNLISPNFSYITSNDLYSIRCGVLHQGRFGDLQHTVEKVIFTISENIQIKNSKVDDAYVYDVVQFCKDMCDATSNWYEANKSDPIIIKNSKRMMNYYPDGMAPYVVGVPCIA